MPKRYVRLSVDWTLQKVTESSSYRFDLQHGACQPRILTELVVRGLVRFVVAGDVASRAAVEVMVHSGVHGPGLEGTRRGHHMEQSQPGIVAEARCCRFSYIHEVILRTEDISA